jgi:hypothetical protein
MTVLWRDNATHSETIKAAGTTGSLVIFWSVITGLDPVIHPEEILWSACADDGLPDQARQ